MEFSELQELKKKLFDITLAVWRVTDLFPKDEPLRIRIRTRASEILEECIFYLTLGEKEYVGKGGYLAKIHASIKAMQALFVIAKTQRFVNGINFEILDWEYQQILLTLTDMGRKVLEETRNETIPVSPSKEKASKMVVIEKSNPGRVLVSIRQKKILDRITEATHARLKEILVDFPGMSEKTIRNDLKVLCEKRLVQFNGKPPQSYYSVNGSRPVMITGRDPAFTP